MQITTLKVPGLPIVITPAAGIVTNNLSINVNNIENWSTRFESCFEEYRILMAMVEIRPLGVNNGVSAFWFDEHNANAPTVAEAEAKTSTLIANSNANSKAVKTMTWRARDFGDLTYSAANITNTPVSFFKTYTDVTNYGTPATTTTPLFLIRINYLIEFRGIAPIGAL